MKLTADNLATIAKIYGTRHVMAEALTLTPEGQEIWHTNVNRREVARGRDPVSLDDMLCAALVTLETVQVGLPIYLLDPAIDVESKTTGPVSLDTARIVVWRDHVAFFSRGVCLTADEEGHLSTHEGGIPYAVANMLELSQQPAEARAPSTNERRAIAKAGIGPRKSIYYVPNRSYEARPSEPKGGTHRSPVAHDRRAHEVVMTYSDVQPADVARLEARGYKFCTEIPDDVAAAMRRQGKHPIGLCAYRRFERSGSRPNANGPKAQKVVVLH